MTTDGSENRPEDAEDAPDRGSRRAFVAGAGGALGGAAVAAIALGQSGRSERVVVEGPSRDVDVTRFGARGDGASDDSPAIEAALASIPDRGGVLLFPPGTYRCTRAIVLDNRRSLTLRGSGGSSAGAAQPSVLEYDGSANSFVSGRRTTGLTISDLAMVYTGSRFRGRLVDLSHEEPQVGSVLASFTRCYLGGRAPTAACLVSVDDCHSVSFNECHFSGALVGIKGRETTGSYANVIRVQNCNFNGNVLAHILNAGQTWLMVGCTFEPLASNAAGAFSLAPGFSASATSFVGCWFGDAAPQGDWIRWAGGGLTVIGCFLSGGASGVRLAGSSNTGVFVSGNQFAAMPIGIDLATSSSGAIVLGNDFQPSVSHAVLASGAGPGSLRQTGTDTLVAGGTVGFENGAAGGLRFPGGAAIYETPDGAIRASAPVVLDQSLVVGGIAGPSVTSGSGSPEGRVSAPVGSLYLDSRGTAGKTLYVKENGKAAAGWVAR